MKRHRDLRRYVFIQRAIEYYRLDKKLAGWEDTDFVQRFVDVLWLAYRHDIYSPRTVCCDAENSLYRHILRYIGGFTPYGEKPFTRGCLYHVWSREKDVFKRSRAVKAEIKMRREAGVFFPGYGMRDFQ